MSGEGKGTPSGTQESERTIVSLAKKFDFLFCGWMMAGIEAIYHIRSSMEKNMKKIFLFCS